MGFKGLSQHKSRSGLNNVLAEDVSRLAAHDQIRRLFLRSLYTSWISSITLQKSSVLIGRLLQKSPL